LTLLDRVVRTPAQRIRRRRQVRQVRGVDRSAYTRFRQRSMLGDRGAAGYNRREHSRSVIGFGAAYGLLLREEIAAPSVVPSRSAILRACFAGGIACKQTDQLLELGDLPASSYSLRRRSTTGRAGSMPMSCQRCDQGSIRGTVHACIGVRIMGIDRNNRSAPASS